MICKEELQMTFFEIFDKFKATLKNADPKTVEGKLAIEFDITGEGEGKFYLLVDEGELHIEPYDYVDNDAKLIADADTLIRIAAGRVKPQTAYATGALKAEGNVGRAMDIMPLIKSAAPARKRSAAKAAPKAPKAAKKAEVPAKPEEKKPAEKKVAEKKEPEKKPVEEKKAPAKKASK